jgi:hypothetical protein
MSNKGKTETLFSKLLPLNGQAESKKVYDLDDKDKTMMLCDHFNRSPKSTLKSVYDCCGPVPALCLPSFCFFIGSLFCCHPILCSPLYFELCEGQITKDNFFWPTGNQMKRNYTLGIPLVESHLNYGTA